eukprot:8401072-Alexandrium_andersonii.AAC.1
MAANDQTFAGTDGFIGDISGIMPRHEDEDMVDAEPAAGTSGAAAAAASPQKKGEEPKPWFDRAKCVAKAVRAARISINSTTANMTATLHTLENDLAQFNATPIQEQQEFGREVTILRTRVERGAKRLPLQSGLVPSRVCG